MRMLRLALALVIGGALSLWALLGRDFRTGDNLLGGIGVGLVIVGMWYVSGHIGYVQEDPNTLQEAFVATNYAALFDSHAAHLRAGLNVVADLGIHDDYSRPLGIYADALARLAGLDVLWVGVACPIEVIMARRNADPRGGHYVAGDGVPDPVRRWQQAVHAGKRYDLVVDGGSAPPAEGAAAILAALERQMPRATR